AGEGAGFRAGDAVEVRDMGYWWPAEVLEVRAGGRLKIRFSGYDSSWDRVAGPKEGRRPSAAAAPAPTPGYGMAFGPVVVDQVGAMLTGRPVLATTPLSAGQRVLVRWHGSWFEGEVVEVQPDGRVKIHYADWDPFWDEVVPRSSLQLPGG